MIDFGWPWLLWLLALVPALVAGYLWLLRRRRRHALRFASLVLVRQAIGAGPSWRRHVPPALLLLAVTLLIVSVARPSSVLQLPSLNRTIILAMDVSGSMRAKDVAPTRGTAAQDAARAFLAGLPETTRVGIVTFAATAQVVQPPTREHADVLAAIDRFQLQRGTAIGSGILVSLQSIFPDVEFDLRSTNPRRPPRESARGGGGERKGAELKGGDAKGADAKGGDGKGGAAKTVAPGSYTSAAIVLLTDGQSNTGPDALEAARMAAERGVRVYTVGIGTPAGEVLSGEGWSMRVKLDEDTLKSIASITRSGYWRAGDAEQLKAIYESLNSRLVFERRETEITAVFAAVAAAIALIAVGLSVAWYGRTA